MIDEFLTLVLLIGLLGAFFFMPHVQITAIIYLIGNGQQ